MKKLIIAAILATATVAGTAACTATETVPAAAPSTVTVAPSAKAPIPIPARFKRIDRDRAAAAAERGHAYVWSEECKTLIRLPDGAISQLEGASDPGGAEINGVNDDGCSTREVPPTRN